MQRGGVAGPENQNPQKDKPCPGAHAFLTRNLVLNPRDPAPRDTWPSLQAVLAVRTGAQEQRSAGLSRGSGQGPHSKG